MNVSRLIAVLCREPFSLTPKDVAELTPYQVSLLLCDRTEAGEPILPYPPDPWAEVPMTHEERFFAWARCQKLPNYLARRLWDARTKRPA